MIFYFESKRHELVLTWFIMKLAVLILVISLFTYSTEAASRKQIKQKQKYVSSEESGEDRDDMQKYYQPTYFDWYDMIFYQPPVYVVETVKVKSKKNGKVNNKYEPPKNNKNQKKSVTTTTTTTTTTMPPRNRFGFPNKINRGNHFPFTIPQKSTFAFEKRTSMPWIKHARPDIFTEVPESVSSFKHDSQTTTSTITTHKGMIDILPTATNSIITSSTTSILPTSSSTMHFMKTMIPISPDLALIDEIKVSTSTMSIQATPSLSNSAYMSTKHLDSTASIQSSMMMSSSEMVLTSTTTSTNLPSSTYVVISSSMIDKMESTPTLSMTSQMTSTSIEIPISSSSVMKSDISSTSVATSVGLVSITASPVSTSLESTSLKMDVMVPPVIVPTSVVIPVVSTTIV